MGGAEEFRALALRLKAAGEGGLRKELFQAIDDAAEPLARQIASPAHLKPYMPDRYAGVLASDLKISVSKLAGKIVFGVRLVAKGRAHQRKVSQVNRGVLQHPLYGNKTRWFSQTGGMKPGFFSDPTMQSAPAVRDRITAAMHVTAAKIMKG